VKILKISKSNSIGGALYITSEENSKKNVSLVRQNGFDPAFFFKNRKVQKIVSLVQQNGFDPEFYFLSRKVQKIVSFAQQNGFDPAFFFKAEKSKKLSVFWFNKMVLTQQFFVQKCRFRLTK
jgi:hypothetical protein